MLDKLHSFYKPHALKKDFQHYKVEHESKFNYSSKNVLKTKPIRFIFLRLKCKMFDISVFRHVIIPYVFPSFSLSINNEIDVNIL